MRDFLVTLAAAATLAVGPIAILIVATNDDANHSHIEENTP